MKKTVWETRGGAAKHEDLHEFQFSSDLFSDRKALRTDDARIRSGPHLRFEIDLSLSLV